MLLRCTLRLSLCCPTTSRLGCSRHLWRLGSSSRSGSSRRFLCCASAGCRLAAAALASWQPQQQRQQQAVFPLHWQLQTCCHGVCAQQQAWVHPPQARLCCCSQTLLLLLLCDCLCGCCYSLAPAMLHGAGCSCGSRLIGSATRCEAGLRWSPSLVACGMPAGLLRHLPSWGPYQTRHLRYSERYSERW